jgi:hypothetical protein
MRLPRGIVVSLTSIALASPQLLAQEVAEAATPPQQPANAAAVAAPPASHRLNTSGLSHFELQRLLGDLDERRKRLKASVEPADSVQRLFVADSQRIAAAARPAVIQQDSIAVRQLFLEYRQDPTNRDLLRRLTSAVDAASIDFRSSEQSLNAKITGPYAARAYLERSPYAAVVPMSGELPLEGTFLWQKLHQAEEARVPPAPLVYADLNGFFAALSDSAFAAYKASVLLAFAARAGDIRTLTKVDRDEFTTVNQDAAQVSRDIGTREDAQAKLDARLINIGLPALAVALVALLLTPLLYRNIDLQRAIFSSGLMLELMTVFLLTGAIILLGLDGRIPAEVIGTLLGGISGYVLGRSVNPLVVDRRS